MPAISITIVQERRIDHDEDHNQCCCLNQFENNKIIRKKRLILTLLSISAGMGALIVGYLSAIIYATGYAQEEVKRSPWKYLVEKEVSFMLCLETIAFTAGAPMHLKFHEYSGRMASVGCVAVQVIGLALPVFVFGHSDPSTVWIGLLFLGLSVGTAFTNLPIYIAELSPAPIRGALVSTVYLQIVLGQTLYHLLNLFYPTKGFGTWHWTLAIIPGIFQFIMSMMGWLPESPRWLYRNGKKELAVETLKFIRHPCEVGKEVEAMELSRQTEIAEEGHIEDHDDIFNLFNIRGKVPCRRLVAGVGCLVAQQFVGMNMIIHYSYTIFHLTGSDRYSKEEMALAIPLITSALSAVGTIFCTALVDRLGRRRLLLISISGIITSLGLLCHVFYGSVGGDLSFSAIDNNNRKCLGGWMEDQNIMWYTKEDGLSSFGLLALIALAVYIISYSLGMGTVPWIINSEIYPMKYRTNCVVMAAIAYWISKIIVQYFFLDVMGYFHCAADMLFLLYLFSWVVGLFMYLYIPETTGFPLEEVEKLLKLQEKKIKLHDDDGDDLEMKPLI